MQMSNKESTKWLKTKEHFRKFDPIETEVNGIKVFLIDPRDLASYKKHLDGDHQIVDVVAVENYINSQS